MIFDLLHVRIRIKLLGLVLLPVVGGGLLSGLVVAEQTRLLERMQRLRSASSLSIAVGDLVHALQAESVDTALHLGSQGAAHQEAMARAREATNRQRTALEAALGEAEPDLRGLLPAAVREGARLRDLRRRADRQGGTQELIDGYAREVDALLQVQNRLMLPAVGTALEGRFQAFATLLRAKESAGLEGALLANAFSLGTLDAPGVERFQGLADGLKAQGEAFLATVPESTREDFRRALTGPFAGELHRMRGTVKVGRLEQDPEAWVRSVATELQAYKGLQDRMSRELLGEARGLERGARTKSWALAAGFGVFGLAVLLWTWRATVLLTEPIHALADGMARLQNGDLRAQLPIHSFDETGQMTGAFNTMSAHLRELVRALQAHAVRVSTSATGLSVSAEQVSAATQQLGASNRIQRLASEDVAQAVAQLQASVAQVRANLNAMVDGGRSAAGEVQDAERRARTLTVLFQELQERAEPGLHGTLHEAEAQVATILQALGHVAETLGAIEVVAGEIHRAAEDQAQASGEVGRRMEASRTATAEVQLAAAQLANTAPEVVITTKDLVQVAQALKHAASAFRVE